MVPSLVNCHLSVTSYQRRLTSGSLPLSFLMRALNAPDACPSLRTISLFVTFKTLVLFDVVVPRTLKFPLTVRLRNVVGVVVEAPLAVTVASVSVSVNEVR